MRIIKDKKIEVVELREMAKRMYENLVKAVVDVEKEIMAVDAEMHVDLEQFLIEQEGCEPKNLWGINLWPEKTEDDFVEFDSMINLKPGLGNRSRGVESEEIRNKIKIIVGRFI